MIEINVKEARSQLSQLLNKVEQGQQIVLTRRGKKVACLVSPQQERSLPSLKKFRESLDVSGTDLSTAVMASREEERY